MTSQPKQQKVFISHAMRDTEEARAVASTLRQAGLETWLDEEQLRAGENFADAIKRGLEDSNAVVVLIGDQPSRWTHYEWSAIVERLWEDPDTQVVPVLVGDAEPPGFLRDVQAVRLDPAAGSGGSVAASILDRLRSGDSRALETPEGHARLKRRLDEVVRTAAALEAEPDDPVR
ncbi:MAG TPA: toll/interleukin-1 receptor domain-containing protein [Thermoleophilaceae bacterium]